MEPFEIMISESQERMLCVVEPERVDAVLAVCEKWEVNATAIGVVTDTGRLRVLVGDAVAGDVPVTALVDECPAYDLEPAPPSDAALPAPPPRHAGGRRWRREATLLALLGSANLASRRPVFEQYDCDRRLAHRAPPRAGRRRRADARAATAARPALAVSIDGNGRRVASTPTAARSRRCWSARRTSPASAPSRSA